MLPYKAQALRVLFTDNNTCLLYTSYMRIPGLWEWGARL